MPITGPRRSPTSQRRSSGAASAATASGSPSKPAPARRSASSTPIATAITAERRYRDPDGRPHFRQVHVLQDRSRLAPPRRRAARRRQAEFLAACEDFALDRSLRAYSTIGTRGDVDLVLLSQSPNLDDLHTFHVVLGQSGLAKWAETPYSFLSMTKRSPYSEEEARPEICVSERKYLFLYPMVKQRRWYGLPAEERGRIMKSHIEVGRRYPEITINTSYSFGLDDQEFVVAFEGDDPGDVPRPGAGAAPDRVERLHRARDADLHLRGDVGAQGARRSRRHRQRRRGPAGAVKLHPYLSDR